MEKPTFDWDENKDEENPSKHGVSFSLAQHAFLDPLRVIVEDVSHSSDEDRFCCIGRVNEGIITVRFTYRGAGRRHSDHRCGILEKGEKDL